MACETKIQELTKRVTGDLERMRLLERIASDLQTKAPDLPTYCCEPAYNASRGGGGGSGVLGMLVKR